MMLIHINKNFAVDPAHIVSIHMGKSRSGNPMVTLQLQDEIHCVPFEGDFSSFIDTANAIMTPVMTLKPEMELKGFNYFESLVENPFHGYEPPAMNERDSLIMEMATQKGGEYIDEDLAVIAFKSIDFVNLVREISKPKTPEIDTLAVVPNRTLLDHYSKFASANVKLGLPVESFLSGLSVSKVWAHHDVDLNMGIPNHGRLYELLIRRLKPDAEHTIHIF